MAEYLSPGVYVEEYDSGVKAMEGVGTSTAGFVGMAQKGPVRGLPVLITSMADYRRRFGGYLSQQAYGELRFLPYAVEQFFNNGGSACYVMRVCPGDAKAAKVSLAGSKNGGSGSDKPFLTLAAASPGAWGNNIQVRFTPSLKNRVRLCESVDVTAAFEVEKADGYQAGDMVCLQYRALRDTGTKDADTGDTGSKGADTEDKNVEDTGTKDTDTNDKEVIDIDTKDADTKETDTNDKEVIDVDTKDADTNDKEVIDVDTKDADTNDKEVIDIDTKDINAGHTGGKNPGEGASPQTAASAVSYIFAIVEKNEGGKITLKQQGAALRDAKAEFLYLAEWELIVSDDSSSEQYENVSFNSDRTNFVPYAVLKSRLITAEAHMNQYASGVFEGKLTDAQEPSFTVSLEGGEDGTIKLTNKEMDVDLYKGMDGSPDQRSGLQAFKTLSDVSIMAIPGITNTFVQSELVSHCDNLKNRFAILDMPLEYKDVSELQEFRENVDSSYAAMYHPWLQCYDSLARRNVFLPPSGAVAGIYGRTDNSRGVHKAPANEVVRNCTGLSVRYNEAEQSKLNPRGINLIRSLPGQGIRVWGARTCSGDGNWKYVNVRRLFIFIEESIKANTNWVVFEPNDEMLWSRVEGTIRVFLTTQWRNGALAGSTADEAFFINIGKSTMTEDDILNGRLICDIGVAPVRPAEFVIFRITQKMENAQ